MKIKVANGQAVAKRMLWLAYQASKVVGMGYLMAKDDVTEDMLASAHFESGRNGECQYYADYAYGRMMKAVIRYGNSHVEFTDSAPQLDYESWAGKYKTYQSLAEAAIASL